MLTHLTNREMSARPISALRRARHLCAILFLPLAASCSAWLPVPGAGLAPAPAERVGHARVFLRDGTVLSLSEVTIDPDSIVGLGGAPATRFAVARSDVAKVDTRSTDRITPFLGGILAIVAPLFLIPWTGGM